MGSGLILLVIVGAWLAVLVPMALRSHESSRSIGTAEKFQDAMRVLSRRDATPGAPRASVASGASGASGATGASGHSVASGATGASGARVVRRGAAPAPAFAAPSPVSPSPVALGPAPRAASRRVDPARVAASRAALAARRRRVLAGLALLALATLFGGLVGPSWLLAVHALVDLLLVAYVGHLRHQQVLRAEREWRGALAERAPAERARARRRPVVDELELDETPGVPARPSARRATTTNATTNATNTATTAAVRVAAPARIAGIPDTMPPRPAPLEAPVRGAQGEPWAPVPVPLPGYVTAPTAPRRVLDLTRPGGWSDGVAAAERDLGIDDPGPELDEILERRRAAGDW